MTGLADRSVGDARLALAQIMASAASSPTEQAEATAAFESATTAIIWLAASCETAEAEFDRRRLLGIGCIPDYMALASEWKGNYFTGYGKEAELAWIYSLGPAKMRDYIEAWDWLALGQARWGDQAAELPGSSVGEIENLLKQRLSQKRRKAALARAASIAYSEFVRGK